MNQARAAILRSAAERATSKASAEFVAAAGVDWIFAGWRLLLRKIRATSLSCKRGALDFVVVVVAPAFVAIAWLLVGISLAVLKRTNNS
jgi:hypothetical protein